jgi:tetratricopeptide (TPR) repeat protein
MKTAKIKITLALFAMAFVQLTVKGQSIQDGIKAMETDRYEKASQIFRNIIKTAPNAEAYYYLGDIYLEFSKSDSARMMFTKGIAADAKNPLNYVGLGELALEDDNSAEYKKNFEKALSLTPPKDVRPYHLIGEAYISSSNKRPSDAITILNKAKEIDPKNPETYILLGDAFLAQGKGGDAISNYEKAVQFNKSLPKPHVKIGVLYTRARNFTEAQTALQNALAIDSTYGPAYRELGELYYRAKKYDKAAETYRKYVQLSGNSVSAKSRYASFLFLNKEYQKATEVINEVIRVDSSNVIMKRLLGYSFYEQKEYDKALKYMEGFFRKVDKKKIIPNDYEYMGKIFSRLNQDSLAILNYKKAIELDDSKTDLYPEIAASYNKLKDFREAAKWLELKMSGGRPTSTDYFLLARTYYFDKNYQKADSLFSKLTEIQPKWHPGFLWRGRVQSAMDSTQTKTFAAKESYDKVIELASADPVKNKTDLLEAYNYLAFYYIQKDENTNAKTTYKKILELDPENKEAKENLKQLK